MAIFRNKFTVKANIEKVWNFYTEINHLEIITPKKINLKIINTTGHKITLGQESDISANLLTNRKWHSKITSFQRYEYTDEMLTGPLKKWKHIHGFNKISNYETEVIDEIEFELPYGIIGKIVSRYVLYNLKKLFEQRSINTINFLTNN